MNRLVGLTNRIFQSISAALSWVGSHWRKLFIYIVAILIIVQLVQLFIAFYLMDYFIGTLSSLFGINPFLAKALRYLLLVPLGILAAFLFRPGRIQIALMLMFSYLAVCNLLFYFLSVGTVPNRIDYQSALSHGLFGKTKEDIKIWYSINDKGEYELFDSPGVDRFGKSLIPASPKEAPQVIASIESVVRQQEKSKYYTPVLTKQKLCLCLINSEIDTISNKLASQGIQSNRTIFSQRFIDDGKFEAVFAKDTRVLKELGTADYCEYLLLGKVEVSSLVNSGLEGLITTNAIVIFTFISLSDFQIKQLSLNSKGVGFSPATSEKDAKEKLSEQLTNKVISLLQ